MSRKQSVKTKFATHLKCVHAAHVVNVVVLGNAALLEADVEDVLAAVVLEEALKLLNTEVTVQGAGAFVCHETVQAEHAQVN